MSTAKTENCKKITALFFLCKYFISIHLMITASSLSKKSKSRTERVKVNLDIECTKKTKSHNIIVTGSLRTHKR